MLTFGFTRETNAGLLDESPVFDPPPHSDFSVIDIAILLLAVMH